MRLSISGHFGLMLHRFGDTGTAYSPKTARFLPDYVDNRQFVPTPLFFNAIAR